MKRAFAVTIEIEDSANPEVIAGEISDALTSEGYDVTSVNPWDTADSAPATPSQPFPRF